MKTLWMTLLTACAGLVLAAPARATVTCRVELDRGVLPARSTQKAIVKVTLEAPAVADAKKRPPVNLALVLDRSGSMSGDKIEKAREAAISAIRRLQPEDLVSVVVYDHEVETLVPAQPAKNIEWIEARIRDIKSRGNTALFGGVSQGAAEVRKNLEGKYIHRIVLLSDGLANVGPASADDLGRLGASLMKEHISVSTIGLGQDYNEDLMTKLSGQSDGNSYFAETSDDLPTIFAKELGDVLSVAASKVTLEVEFPAGIRPVRVIGREGRMNGNRIEFTLNQLYGGQEKYALVEVEVPASDAKADKEIASARCSYEDPVSQRLLSSEGRARATFSESNDEIQRNVNGDVQVEFAKNWSALNREEAIKLAEEGRRDEASKKLKASNEYLRQNLAPAAAAAPAVQQALQQVDADAETLEKRDFSKSERKASKTASFEVFNQQKQ